MSVKRETGYTDEGSATIPDVEVAVRLVDRVAGDALDLAALEPWFRLESEICLLLGAGLVLAGSRLLPLVVLAHVALRLLAPLVPGMPAELDWSIQATLLAGAALGIVETVVVGIGGPDARGQFWGSIAVMAVGVLLVAPARVLRRLARSIGVPWLRPSVPPSRSSCSACSAASSSCPRCFRSGSWPWRRLPRRSPRSRSGSPARACPASSRPRRSSSPTSARTSPIFEGAMIGKLCAGALKWRITRAARRA